MGFLPCDDKNVYWFFTWTPTDQDEEAEHDSVKMRQLILSKMKSEMSGVVASPLRYRWPFDILTGSISKGNVSVAGDSLHPMTPDLGQGGCSALEDAIVLSRSLGEALQEGKLGNATEEEEYASIKKGLEKYAKERRWRSFDLVATAYAVGYMQQSEGVIMSFLRDKCFPGILARTLIKRAGFDCGMI
ncbi:hypothetical protein KSP39_PZI022870 [Platanthera zijinensis]|uniref:FAD-binding domain-containing protein n=1 Tax=Platanthera zijinensis TaxID=2320716 RepID=A0AAP0AWJ5_9ASPA